MNLSSQDEVLVLDELTALFAGPLALQGGPMTATEAAVFEAGPYLADAVAVRRWDEAAKDPAVTPPPFGHFEELLRGLLRRA
jgi:gamma-butyrobetaine dioxygenase